MVQNMKGIQSTRSLSKVKELKYGLMEQSMKVNGKTIKHLEKELFIMLTVTYMKVNLRKTEHVATAYT
jgi:hypothetical protein